MERVAIISIISIDSILASITITILSTILISTSIAAGAQTLSLINKRDIIIELDAMERLQTRGELTIPTIGDGPFPAVLLIHSSGATDRDEYLPPTVTGTVNESRPFIQIINFCMKLIVFI